MREHEGSGLSVDSDVEDIVEVKVKIQIGNNIVIEMKC